MSWFSVEHLRQKKKKEKTIVSVRYLKNANLETPKLSKLVSTFT